MHIAAESKMKNAARDAAVAQSGAGMFAPTIGKADPIRRSHDGKDTTRSKAMCEMLFDLKTFVADQLAKIKPERADEEWLPAKRLLAAAIRNDGIGPKDVDAMYVYEELHAYFHSRDLDVNVAMREWALGY